jgi:hypothetical protein
MNGQARQKRLRQMASGATRTIGRHPDYDKTMHASARATLRGDHMAAGVLRAEAGNAESRANMTKAHKPNLGPYTADNPAHCMDCGKPMGEWMDDEECVPGN